MFCNSCERPCRIYGLWGPVRGLWGWKVSGEHFCVGFCRWLPEITQLCWLELTCCWSRCCFGSLNGSSHLSGELGNSAAGQQPRSVILCTTRAQAAPWHAASVWLKINTLLWKTTVCKMSVQGQKEKKKPFILVSLNWTNLFLQVVLFFSRATCSITEGSEQCAAKVKFHV